MDMIKTPFDPRRGLSFTLQSLHAPDKGALRYIKTASREKRLKTFKFGDFLPV
jgi:hypothetical protein